jgi:uncharacterized protein (TIGR00369 family)
MSVAKTPVWKEAVRGGYPDRRLLALPGRERLEGWRRGISPPPPLTHLTGAVPTAFGSGTSEAQMPASGWLAASNGLITGGTLAIVADIAFGCSVESELPAATPYTTAELSLSFLRPTRPGGVLIASGQAIHVGRSVGLSEAFVIEQESERLIAHGTSRLTIFPPLDPAPDPPGDLQPWEAAGHDAPDPYLRTPPDSVIPQEIWQELAGVEILGRQLAGELPAPALHHLTGLRLVEIGEGEATFAMPCTEWLASPARRLQGGTIVMLADFAMLAAVQTTTAPGLAFAGLDVKVNFLRPVQGDGREMVAKARVEHSGRTLAIANAELFNADGQRVAIATGSSMYLPGHPAALGEIELGRGETESA